MPNKKKKSRIHQFLKERSKEDTLARMRREEYYEYWRNIEAYSKCERTGFDGCEKKRVPAARALADSTTYDPEIWRKKNSADIFLKKIFRWLIYILARCRRLWL